MGVGEGGRSGSSRGGVGGTCCSLLTTASSIGAPSMKPISGGEGYITVQCPVFGGWVLVLRRNPIDEANISNKRLRV